jgi:hypothetical protein
MGTRSYAQLSLFFIGLIVWAYGVRADDRRLRWIGIVFFAAATLLRFVKRFRRNDGA